MPQLIIDDDLREIARRIKKKTERIGRSGWVWNEDEFQVGHFAGGFVPEPEDLEGPRSALVFMRRMETNTSSR